MFEKLKNGYLTEEKFILECLSKNIPISRPVYNTEPYDFIIEVNGMFKSVQVKKAWSTKVTALIAERRWTEKGASDESNNR